MSNEFPLPGGEVNVLGRLEYLTEQYKRLALLVAQIQIPEPVSVPDLTDVIREGDKRLTDTRRPQRHGEIAHAGYIGDERNLKFDTNNGHDHDGTDSKLISVPAAFECADLNACSIASMGTKSHTLLTDVGTNTHAQIDTHIANVSNPHAVTAAQVSAVATADHTKAVHDALLIDADTLDSLQGTGYTKTTAGQTINVSTAAELTAALAALAAAPSLLGEVIIQHASGTYADDVTIPSLIGNGYSLTLQGGTTTNLSTTATGGTAGNVSTQATVVKTAAGWTTNAYRGQWLKFTSGALNGFIRQINSNTADTITLIGGFFGSAPQNNDAFIVYTNSASITGKISFSHSTAELRFVNLDIGELIGKMATVKLTECKQTVSGYVNYEIDLCDIRYYRSYILVTADISGLWMVTTDVVFYSCHIRGFSKTPAAQWGMLLQGGGITIIRCGTVIENHGWGIWSQIGGFSNCNSGSEDDSAQNPNATNSIIKNNGTGILAQKGGHSQVDLTVFSGNTTDKNAEAASYSWIE